MDAHALRRKVGDLRQVATVRTVTMEEGAERGVRALAFSTGGGLDFWALPDRSLDIATLSWQGRQVGWQSPAGLPHPALFDPGIEEGRGFDRLFGGFLVTCGLDHIRQPADGQPLHGRFPATPMRVLACGEDWDCPDPVLFCEAVGVQARYGGEALRLRRRIEAPVGGRSLTLTDEVENIGTQASPLALLYHFNLGWPLVDDGTTVTCEGETILGPLRLPDEDEQPGPLSRPLRGDGLCTVGNPQTGGMALSFRIDRTGLPHLQTLANLAPGVGLLAIEPCTSARLAGGASAEGPTLRAGESWKSSIEISF